MSYQEQSYQKSYQDIHFNLILILPHFSSYILKETPREACMLAIIEASPPPKSRN